MDRSKPPEFHLRRVPVHRPRSEPTLYRLVPTGERWPMTRHEFLRATLLGAGGAAAVLGGAGCGGGGGGDAGGGGGGGPAGTCPAPTTPVLDENAYRAYTQAQIRAHASQVNVLTFSGDGRWLASAGGSGGTAGNGNRDHTEIKLWSVPSGRLMNNISDDLPTSGLEFSDDSRTLYASTPAGFHTWAVEPTRLVGSITGPVGQAFVARNGAVKTAGVSPGVNPTVRLAAWNLASGAKLFDVADPLPKEPYNVVMNDASTVLAVAFVDGDLQLREATGTHALLHSMDAAAERPAMAFSPDGRLLASGGGLTYASTAVNPAHGDTAISLWDVASGALLRRLVGHGNRVNSLAFSADGSRLVSGSGGNATTAGLPSFYAPGNNPFAHAQDENSVRVWDTASGAQRQAFTGLAWRINAVAISPDGLLVAAGSRGNSIALWNAQDGSFVAGLFDPSALEPDKTANYVDTRLPGGAPVQRALPTSAALAAGATCTCNCVAGSYVPKPPASRGGPCALVCVCVPVTFPG